MWSAYTREEQRHLLEGLDVWVRWLVDHYRLDRRYIPECWTKHWELIEELSALQLAWEGAYATTSHGDAPLAWHVTSSGRWRASAEAKWRCPAGRSVRELG